MDKKNQQGPRWLDNHAWIKKAREKTRARQPCEICGRKSYDWRVKKIYGQSRRMVVCARC